jgi:hypothetical protein
MFFDWTPGKRISNLPRWLHGPALLSRNLWHFPSRWDDWRQRRRDWNNRNAREVRKHLALSVEYVCGADVHGDIAEFGTMTGRTAVDLACALAQFDNVRKLLLFDSFQGLPATKSVVDRDSPHVQAGIWRPGACHGVSKTRLSQMCRKHLAEERLLIFDGWFCDTLPTLSTETRFALLHIDSDLYQSAKDVLTFVFSHGIVSAGAMIHFDDWNCNRADPQCGERRAWSETVSEFSVQYSDGGQYGWAGRKLIVHSYSGAG